MHEDFVIENGTLIRFLGESHEITVPDSVKVIGKEVFKGMSWITDITLPDGLTEIGENAFKGCRKLVNINFPDSLQKIGDLAFHRCHSLVSVTLPYSVSHLGKGTFLCCDSLKKFEAFGVKRLEMQTFANNTLLSDLALNCDIDCSNFKKDVFTGCLNLGTIRLSDGYFYKTDDMISAIISESPVHPVVRAIAESLYQSLEIENGTLNKFFVNLKNLTLPDGIKCIGKGCFFDKKGIVSISFPNSLERIMTNAFGNCISLEKITINSEKIIIDDGAFRGCSNLKTVILGDRSFELGGMKSTENLPYIIRRINDQVMSGFYISGRVLMAYSGSEERVTIPDGVEIIGESCFEGNDKLNRVIMSDSVREIHENAFRNCICMQTVVMSENLRKIAGSAFENCKKLIRFNVPESLSEVGFAAFRGCQCLELSQFETGTPLAVPMNERIYGNDDIAPYSFVGDGSVTELALDTPRIIGKYAFSACPNLVSVTVNAPDCIIERNAFEKCNSLRNIKIHAGKTEKGAFAFCRSLENADISGFSALEDETFAGCSSLENISLSPEISTIGRRCFDECTALKKIDFCNIRRIGERAFERCDGLTEISLKNAYVGYHAFADCSSLKTIIIDSDTTLQSGAFSGCTWVDTIILDGITYHFSKFAGSRNTAENHLPIMVQEIIGSIYSCFAVNDDYGIVRFRGDAEKVRIPDDIVSAEDEAFRDHLRVADIDFPKGFRYSGKLTFSGTGWLEKMRKIVRFNMVNGLLIDAVNCGEIAEIPENTQRICSWAFAGNTELKVLILKNDRLSVDTFAFRNCINLREIHFPDGNIYTLKRFSDLENKNYPDLVKRIFTECINCFKMAGNGILAESTGNIKGLVFPDGIREIADQVYMECNLLENITLSAETEIIGRSAFKNSKWLKNVRNAGGVSKINAHAFSGCTSLESVDIGDKLEFLGKRAFEHCCNLREIHISSELSEIPERAFFRCKNLKKVIIPESVKIIGSQAFAFCSELEEVVFFDRDGIEIADDAFAWCDKL